MLQHSAASDRDSLMETIRVYGKVFCIIYTVFITLLMVSVWRLHILPDYYIYRRDDRSALFWYKVRD